MDKSGRGSLQYDPQTLQNLIRKFRRDDKLMESLLDEVLPTYRMFGFYIDPREDPNGHEIQQGFRAHFEE